jgi:hypothetical protein
LFGNSGDERVEGMAGSIISNWFRMSQFQARGALRLDKRVTDFQAEVLKSFNGRQLFGLATEARTVEHALQIVVKIGCRERKASRFKTLKASVPEPGDSRVVREISDCEGRDKRELGGLQHVYNLMSGWTVDGRSSRLKKSMSPSNHIIACIITTFPPLPLSPALTHLIVVCSARLKTFISFVQSCKHARSCSV